ncbi:MAG: N-acetyltransferase [Candidatus Dadabacteria bacterium]|nr:MAG: N-acetyltransferase [Candidatus Dadabacteria bacterium]
MPGQEAAPTTAQVLDTIHEIPAAEWDTLVEAGNPFLRHAFLSALEDAGCTGPNTSWRPAHIVLHAPDDRPVAAAPLFIRDDSWGEFIFDFEWANAWQRAGLRYYPKGTVAAPFTPAAGRRLLTHPDADRPALLRRLSDALVHTAQQHQLSSTHVLFCRPTERDALCDAGFAERLTYQFHWYNRGYARFDDFLADLRKDKRKQIRRERAAVAREDVTIETVAGRDIGPELLDAMWTFYRQNQSDRWGNTYLNRDWFFLVHERMPDNIVMVVARHAGQPIAASFNFVAGPHLYGRYWGCTEHVEFLHFECCYYRLIEYAIEHGITLFEAGAQGEHKFLRGFAAVPTWSAHWFPEGIGRDAISRYLAAEREAMREQIHAYNRVSPLKAVRAAAAEGTPWPDPPQPLD